MAGKSDKKKKAAKAARAKARQQAQEQAKRSGRGGSSTVSAPADLEFFKAREEGSQTLSVLPFTVTKNRALLSNIDSGDFYYKVSYKIHRGVGPEEKVVVCPKTFGKACPICEEYTTMRKGDAEYDEYKGLRPSDRDLYLVVSKGKLQLMEIPWFWFGKLLDNEIKEDDNEDKLFFFPEDNIDLRVDWETDKFGTKAVAIRFKKRKEDLDEELIEQAEGIDLGDCVIETSYADIQRLLHGVDEGDEDDPDKDPDDEPDENPDNEGDNDPEDKDGDDDSGDDEPKCFGEYDKKDDDCKECDSRKACKKAEDKGDEKESPKEDKKKDKGKSTKCPHDYKFGKDYDEYDECDDCKNQDACEKVS